MFVQIRRLRNGDNILARHALNVLSSAQSSSKSWFWRLRDLCLQYGLPHPQDWLTSQPSKLQVKSMTKTAVLQHWLAILRTKTMSLPSLKYLRTDYLGLTTCHPIFTTCRSSPWEVEKATTQARMLSGRYGVEALSGHWTPWNKGGLCTLPDCWLTKDAHKGTLESLLLSCVSLSSVRRDLMHLSWSHMVKYPVLSLVIKACLTQDPAQFWVDCSSMPMVISAVQRHGQGVLVTLFKLTRNYCHVLHKARMALLTND